MRKTITAIAAAAALGTVTMATGAMAFPHGGSVGHMSAPSGGAMSVPGRSGNFAAPNGGPGLTARPNMAMPNQFAANPKVGQSRAWNGHGHAYHRGHGYGFGFGGLYAYGGPDYYDYYAGDNCYQWQRVWTPLGLRWRDVWVCD